MEACESDRHRVEAEHQRGRGVEAPCSFGAEDVNAEADLMQNEKSEGCTHED